ncbi:dihydrofolate reductase family protein [Actinoplanes aureus]|uniref:Dihydrofolate reductase family protein n=1 Tax=Actinoplanes aureus TaxID=2792083 RepID=A0A931G0J2_9ACTN|nr:dihydrofolate reductase family protein [Actinoplanes aureus]MBG0565797.1 dihydrofolate reductase family protein [Actinoplanes aureus]
MGRVIVQQWISVDGFVAGPGGEADVFAAVEDFSASEAHNLALLDSVGEILLGRRTYEAFVAFWPTVHDEPMAGPVNTIPKTVCSTTLTRAPWGEHAPAAIVPDAVAHVRSRRDSQKGDTIVWGSVRLMRSLLEAGEVDLLELFVAPVALGAGTPLLGHDDHPVTLRVAETESWPGDVIRTRYAVRAGRG